MSDDACIEPCDLDDTRKHGVRTYSWGRSYWFVLHTITQHLHKLGFLDINRFTKEWILSPAYLLPCIFCRQSFQTYIQYSSMLPEEYLATHKLPEFLWLIHNMVNRKLKKPNFPLSILAQYSCSDENHFA